jgi:hypothetical protein
VVNSKVVALLDDLAAHEDSKGLVDYLKARVVWELEDSLLPQQKERPQLLCILLIEYFNQLPDVNCAESHQNYLGKCAHL